MPKVIYTASTQPMSIDPEGGPGFWVSIDGASWLPIGKPERAIEPDDYEEVAALFARRETEKFGKKSWFAPMTFARRFLYFYDQTPIFHEPIIVEADAAELLKLRGGMRYKE